MPGPSRFDVTLGRPVRRRPPEDPDRPGMRILLCADFTGRAARPGPPLAARAPRRVDVDSFEHVLGEWAPRLLLPADGGSSSSTLLEFRSLDDFHPDALSARIPAVAGLLAMRGRLLDARTSAAAVAELRGAGAPPSPPPAAPAAESDSALLERLLGRPSEPVRQRAATVVSDLVRRLVAPQIAPAVEPEAPQLVAALDDAAGTEMRRVLHHPAFRALESAWRAAHLVVSSLQTGDDLRVHLLDVTKDELVEAFAGARLSVEGSTLHRILTKADPDGGQDVGWWVLAGDFRFGGTQEDVDLLRALGALGACLGGPFLGEADAGLLGCVSLAETPDPRDWAPLEAATAERWSALRRSAAAPWLGLVLPRLMLRAPYGRAADPIDGFPFEEMPSPPPHEAYLWGSPAFACALLLGQAYEDAGPAMSPGDRQDLADLPSHAWVQAGAPVLTPSAEVALSERAVDAILARGLMPMVSFAHRNLVRLARFQSLADPPAALSGAWDVEPG